MKHGKEDEIMQNGRDMEKEKQRARQQDHGQERGDKSKRARFVKMQEEVEVCNYSYLIILP